MRVHRAAWILPITSPALRDGWVAIEHGRIVAFGGPAEVPPDGFAGDRQAVPEPEVILPGLVNAHTHLELSWMRGRVPPDAFMPAWAARLMACRRTVAVEPLEPITRAVAELRASGTGLVGDITNTLASYGPLVEAGVPGCLFRELLGFASHEAETAVTEARLEMARLEQPGRLHCSVVPHAPYSVGPALFEAIARTAGKEEVISVHLGESLAEIEFLQHGRGSWRELLERLGAWDSGWVPPACGPVAYLERFGLVHRRLLAVHAVHLTNGELARLAAAGATVVTCPRSNRWTGAGDPPVARFYASGVRVAIGTDSLASGDDLNLFAELAALRALAPGVPAARLLHSATASGADALGFGDAFGRIAVGARADLIAVRVPPDIPDVEEYLIGGIQPASVRWIT